MSFRPRGGNARRKQRITVDSDDDDVNEIKKKLSKAKTAPRPAAPAAKPVAAKILSLEDDDGEEIFKKKKKRPKARGVSTSALDDTNQPNETGGASYSAAALSDLKSKTPKMPSGFAEKNQRAPKQTEGPAVIKISGSFRSNVSTKSHESAMPDTFKMPSKPEGYGIQPPSAPPIPPPQAAVPGKSASKPSSKQAAANNAEEGSDGDDGFAIPTAELIQKAKEKRLRLRGAHMAPGYVPSDHPDFKALKDFKKAEDRIKQGSDDDDSEDEPEEDIRMKFSGVSVKEKRKVHKPIIPSEQHDDEEGGSGSEGDEFAAAQVRRALGSAAANPLARRREAGANVVGNAAAAAKAAGHTSAAARGAAALHSVKELVAGIQHRRDEARQGAQRTTAQVAASAAEAVEADEKYREADERYRFLQTLRAYTRDLCECLNHKIADVEALEEERLAAMQELFEDVRREREEVRAELMVPAAAAVAALQQNKDPEAAAQAAEADAQAATVPEKLDEFGRDENAVRRDRAAARSKARAAALADLKGRFEGSPAAVLCDSEALSAAACGGGVDDTRGGEATAEKTSYYAKRLGELQEVAAHVLDDTAAEFSSMQAVLNKVDEFKQRFPSQYRTAYMSESLPALVSVYVRLQLLSWDPLFQGGESAAGKAAISGQEFMEHAWFQELIKFSSGDNDPDDDLVPAVVAQVLAKHSFSPMLRNAWDPCMRSSSESVRSTLDALLVFETPSTRDNLFALVDTVVDTLARAADGATVPLWPPSVLLRAPVAAAAASAAWDHVTTLIASVTSFQGFLSQERLSAVAGGQLLNKHVVPALHAYVKDAESLAAGKASGNGAKHKGLTAHVPLSVAFQRMLAIAAALPKTWIQGSGSSGGEGAKAVAPLRQVAKAGLRLVGGPGGLRGVRIEEDAEKIRLTFRL